MRFLPLIVLPALVTVSAQAQPRPNVVLILADDLGFADVGFNGLREFDTPHIDRLAASGVRFTNGYVSHPYCSPTRAGLLTGRYQQRFGHEHNPPYEPQNERIGTPLGETLLPQVLQSAGYRTAAVGKWHLGDHRKFHPLERGFDEFFGFSGGGFDYYGVARRSRPEHRIVRGFATVPRDKLTYLTDDFTNEAVRFIRRQRGNPFFLYLAYNAVHAPDQAPQPYLDRAAHIEYGARSVYAAMTIALDDGIGRVLAALDALGLRENTLIFFLSDNGGRVVGADNFPLRGHKGMLYEGGVRVPFVMSWPARLPAGKLYDEPVTALDIFPTAAAAAGASAAQALDGTDLLPFVTGKTAGAPHETLYWRVIAGQGYAVRSGRYKLVKAAAKDRLELFDLQADLRESNNLAADKPEVVARLRKLYAEWNKELVRPLWSDPHAANVVKEFERVREPRRKALPPPARRPL